MTRLEMYRQSFLRDAKITNLEKKYISAAQANQDIPADNLFETVELWMDYLEKNEMDFQGIVGVPEAGNRLAGALTVALKYRDMMNGRVNGDGRKFNSKAAKKHSLPPSWSNVVDYSAESFTAGIDNVPAYIGGVIEGMRILLVDDVVARGETAIAAIKALQAAGAVVVGLLVIFDKLEQGGVERITRETGVDVYSLVTIASVSEDGIKLANTQEAA